MPTLRGYAIGQLLAGVRVRSGLSVWAFATALDMAAGDVLDLESGRAPVSSAVLRAWCERLGVDVVRVLRWAAAVAPPGVRGLVLDVRAAAELPGDGRRGANKTVVAWARRLLDQADIPFLVVPEAEIVLLAARWAIPMCRLVELLADLAPVELPLWELAERHAAMRGGQVR